MSDIMKLIKSKLRGSTTMPAGTGNVDPVHPLAHHDPHAHHHHAAGCCGHDHDHHVMHEHDHGLCHHQHHDPDDDLVDEEDTTTPGRGCC